MFTIKLFLLVFCTLSLLAGALTWERRKNKKNGNLGLEHIPLVAGFAWYQHRRDQREAKLRAKIDILRNL